MGDITVKCKECGKEFGAPSRRRKVCDECIKERGRIYRRKRNAEVTIRVSDDTDEMRSFCLNCTREKCIGECEELAKIARGICNGDQR